MKLRIAVACALIGLSLQGCAAPVSASRAGQDPSAGSALADPASTGEAAGDLALSLAWPSTREIQALDPSVAKVVITVRPAGTQQVPPVEIVPSSFAGGLAKVTIRRLAVGEASIGAKLLGKDGSVLGEGSTKALIPRDSTAEASLSITIKPPSGTLKVTIDSVLGDPEEPIVAIGDTTSRDVGVALPIR